MLKVCETQYIIRFQEGIEVKTLKFKDFESLMYIANKLREEDKSFVIIMHNDLDNTTEHLLDYELE